jgi:hypothetical protein
MASRSRPVSSTPPRRTSNTKRRRPPPDHWFHSIPGMIGMPTSDPRQPRQPRNGHALGFGTAAITLGTVVSRPTTAIYIAVLILLLASIVIALLTAILFTRRDEPAARLHRLIDSLRSNHPQPSSPAPPHPALQQNTAHHRPNPTNQSTHTTSPRADKLSRRQPAPRRASMPQHPPRSPP